MLKKCLFLFPGFPASISHRTAHTCSQEDREGAEDVAKVVAAAEHREVATENLSTSTVGRLQPLAPVFGDQRFDRHEVESTILKLDQDPCGYVSALMPRALVDSLVRMTNVYAAEKLQNAHLKPKSRLRC